MSRDLIHPHRHKQLFLDDGAIEAMSGLRRVLHRPERCGPVLRPDRSRGEKHVQSGSVPQWNSEKSLWEWWYRGYPAYTEDGLCLYATSTDGLHWEQPHLGLYEWNGSTANNIAYRSSERSLYHVIRDEGDGDPRRRYKAFFSDIDHMNRCPGVSPDGLQWTFPDVPPIPSQDTSQLLRDDLAQRYLATVKHRTEWGRSAWLVTSPDFVHWTDPVLVLHTDEIDQENGRRRIQEVVADPAYLSPPAVDDREYIAQIYMLPVMTYEGVYIGFPLLFNPSGADPEHTNHTGLNQVETGRVEGRPSLAPGGRPSRLCGGGTLGGRRQLRQCPGSSVRPSHRARAGDPDLLQRLSFSRTPEPLCRSRSRHLQRCLLGGERGHLSGQTAAGRLRLPRRVHGGRAAHRFFPMEGEQLCVNADTGDGEMLVEMVDAESHSPLARPVGR